MNAGLRDARVRGEAEGMRLLHALREAQAVRVLRRRQRRLRSRRLRVVIGRGSAHGRDDVQAEDGGPRVEEAMHAHAGVDGGGGVRVDEGVVEVCGEALHVLRADVLDDRVDEIEEGELLLGRGVVGALLHDGDDCFRIREILARDLGQAGDDVLRVEGELLQEGVVLHARAAELLRDVGEIELRQGLGWWWSGGDGWGVVDVGLMKHLW